MVPTHVDVTVGTRPFEEIFDAIIGGPREESRSRCSYVDVDHTRALEAPRPADVEIIDAEPLPSDFKPEPTASRYTPPPITGDAAIAEAARINRELGVYDQPRALPAGQVSNTLCRNDFRLQRTSSRAR